MAHLCVIRVNIKQIREGKLTSFTKLPRVTKLQEIGLHQQILHHLRLLHQMKKQKNDRPQNDNSCAQFMAISWSRRVQSTSFNSASMSFLSFDSLSSKQSLTRLSLGLVSFMIGLVFILSAIRKQGVQFVKLAWRDTPFLFKELMLEFVFKILTILAGNLWPNYQVVVKVSTQG